MNQKSIPYLFLASLAIVLFFILGFRTGQSVEKTNKTTSVLLSLAPSYTPAPSAKPLSFMRYAGTQCGIELLYPLSLTVAEESTQSAVFTEKGKTVLQLSCKMWSAPQPTAALNMPTGTVQGRQITMVTSHSGEIAFQVKHPSRNILLSVTVSKDLYPFIERNLGFVK